MWSIAVLHISTNHDLATYVAVDRSSIPGHTKEFLAYHPWINIVKIKRPSLLNREIARGGNFSVWCGRQAVWGDLNRKSKSFFFCLLAKAALKMKNKCLKLENLNPNKQLHQKTINYKQLLFWNYLDMIL